MQSPIKEFENRTKRLVITWVFVTVKIQVVRVGEIY